MNPADTTLNLQAAIKNLATNSVFYFVVAISSLDVLLVSSAVPDVQTYVQLWKGFDDSLEVSSIVNGSLFVDIIVYSVPELSGSLTCVSSLMFE